MATTLSAHNVVNPTVGATFASFIFATGIPASAAPTVQQADSLTVGSSAGQVNCGYSANISVTSGTPFTFNLLSGNDQYGNAVAMVHLCALLFINNSATTAQIFTVGAGTHPAMGSDQGTAQANGGCVYWYNPNPGYGPLVAATNDTITITVASGTSVSGTLIALGRTT
jgi:hypothetical protein